MNIVRVFLLSFFKIQQSLQDLSVTLQRLNYARSLEYSDRINSLVAKILAVEIVMLGPYILAVRVFMKQQPTLNFEDNKSFINSF